MSSKSLVATVLVVVAVGVIGFLAVFDTPSHGKLSTTEAKEIPLSPPLSCSCPSLVPSSSSPTSHVDDPLPPKPNVEDGDDVVAGRAAAKQRHVSGANEHEGSLSRFSTILGSKKQGGSSQWLLSTIEALWESLDEATTPHLTVCGVRGTSMALLTAELPFVQRVVLFVEETNIPRTNITPPVTHGEGSDKRKKNTAEIVHVDGVVRSMLVDARFFDHVGRCDVVVYVPRRSTSTSRMELRRVRSLSSLARNALLLMPKNDMTDRLISWGQQTKMLLNVKRLTTAPVPHGANRESVGGSWYSASLQSIPLYPSSSINRALQRYASVSLEKIDSLATELSRVVDTFLTSDKNVKKELLEGHSGQIVYERKLYSTIAAIPEIKTICEIGFNGGHSAGLWLMVNPTATVHMFDMWFHDYSAYGERFLRNESARYGVVNADARLHIHKGSSLETVPRFAEEHPEVKCDLLSVDGGHTYRISKADLTNMRKLANPLFHVVVVDDTNCVLPWCVDRAVNEMEDLDQLRVIARIGETFTTPDTSDRGVTLFQYRRRQE